MASLKIKDLNPEWKNFLLQSMPEITNYATFHKYKSNQIIFYTSHLPYGIFILVSGKVEITYINNNTEIIFSPALLGISAIKNRSPLSGTFKTKSDCEVYFLSFSAYKKLKGTDNPVAKWISEYI